MKPVVRMTSWSVILPSAGTLRAAWHQRGHDRDGSESSMPQLWETQCSGYRLAVENAAVATSKETVREPAMVMSSPGEPTGNATAAMNAATTE